MSAIEALLLKLERTALAYALLGERDLPALLREAAAALTPPEGWVLVPVEPTEAMKDAVESMKMPHALLRTGVRIADFHERYAAMLAARPDVKP